MINPATHTADDFISQVTIEYRKGYFELFELNTPISRHETLKEAQLIKEMLDLEQAANDDGGYENVIEFH
jgi:hypothetical protein